MVGLARRKDAQVIVPLLELLQAGNAGSLPLEAATALADPVLLPALQQIQAQWGEDQEWSYQLLEEAIVASSDYYLRLVRYRWRRRSRTLRTWREPRRVRQPPL